MKLGLVLEGGASRTYFSCGVMDKLMQEEIWADYLIGASAGIANGISYASRQFGRNIELGTTYLHDKRYMGVRHWLNPHNRSYYNLRFVFGEVPEKWLPFDYDAFAAYPGEVIAVVGATGSAKSSLVNLIPRLYDATDGQVLVDGVDVRDYAIRTLREGIGMVPQQNVLFSGTIADNIRWGDPDATDDEVEQAARDAQAHDFIMSFPEGYQTMLSQGGVNVSGGQKQRLCIARAMIKKPRVLILDDSTSAVDSDTEGRIRESFSQHLKGTTVFIIAQRISSIKTADRILVLDSGKVAGFGTHEELIASNTIYQEIVSSQQKGVSA